MNKYLKKTVLDSHQFISLLLVGFSVASLAIAVVAGPHPPDAMLEGMSAWRQAEVIAFEVYGFLLPPLQSFIVPLVTATAMLAAVNLWLTVKKKLEAV
jgi:hypothetical protein